MFFKTQEGSVMYTSLEFFPNPFKATTRDYMQTLDPIFLVKLL